MQGGARLVWKYMVNIIIRTLLLYSNAIREGNIWMACMSNSNENMLCSLAFSFIF